MSPERSPSIWYEIRVTIAAEAAEAVGEELIRLGARGFAVEGGDRGQVLTAYLHCSGTHAAEKPGGEDASDKDSGDVPPAVLQLEAFLARLPGWGLDPGAAEVSFRTVSESAWRDQWKAFFHPTRVGRHLLICPPWEAPAEADRAEGDVAIVIDPGQAFGTGGHGTTRGALELLERVLAPAPKEGAPPLVPARPTVLDLGTGSGVLAVAAAKLGATDVVAIDDDPAAVEAARHNVRANGVVGAVRVLEGDALAYLGQPSQASTDQARPAGQPHPDLIVANLTTALILAALAPVARALPEGGLFVAAGVSAGEGEEAVRRQAAASGLVELDHRNEEGWVSFLFARRHSPGSRRDSPRAVFYTLGCKANLYDTAGLMNDLSRAGWEVSFQGGQQPGDPGQSGAAEPSVETGRVDHAADLYVVNSCAVTARAEAKSRQLARKLKREHPDALVALVGCYPEVHRREAGDTARAAGADLLLGTTDRGWLVEALRERGLAAAERGPDGAGPVQFIPGAFAGERTRATLKVQDGCEQFCTYCVIPYARGPSRSRPAAEVLEEAARLVRAGFKELVVTGIHLGAWGLDLAADSAAPGVRPAGGSGAPRLAGLIRDIASAPGLARVRLSSVEPMEITDDLLGVLASNSKVCRHLHVPLQSGSDTVLARMNRRYTAADYLAMVRRVREAVPLIGLTTDVMVGFPGETDEEFGATLETVRQARFSRLHVFRFSRRPGTPAADMPGQVDEAVKRARSEKLIRLGRRLGREFRESLVGATLEVLVEKVSDGVRGDRVAEGLTDNYVRVDVPIGPAVQVGDAVKHARSSRAGEESVNAVMPVVIQGLTTEGLTGRRDPDRPYNSQSA